VKRLQDSNILEARVLDLCLGCILVKASVYYPQRYLLRWLFVPARDLDPEILLKVQAKKLSER